MIEAFKAVMAYQQKQQSGEHANALERLEQHARENQRVVHVSVGVIKSAIREIEAQAKVSGKGVFTDMTLNALNSVIKGDA